VAYTEAMQKPDESFRKGALSALVVEWKLPGHQFWQHLTCVLKPSQRYTALIVIIYKQMWDVGGAGGNVITTNVLKDSE
jgi:hypothetical protein